MTRQQLKRIRQFGKKYYLGTDQFHDWHHAELTVKYARMLAKQYQNIDLNILDTACYLHDIGRVNLDDGHPEESAKIAGPFLKKIDLKEDEIEKILHAISVHAKERIYEAKTLEAKLLFDADKLQILSVYGFLRVCFFLIYKRGWNMEKVIDFMWDYVSSVSKENIQTPLAKKILAPEIKQIEKIVKDFKKGYQGNLGT